MRYRVRFIRSHTAWTELMLSSTQSPSQTFLGWMHWDRPERRAAAGSRDAVDAFITRSDSIHNGGLDKKDFILQRLLSKAVVRRRVNRQQSPVG